uniref:Palmdelphin n=1 Tax=Sinocyclocheilus anshuiensis TaxID=1608454 RepID=A0A671P8J6_9TELE
RIEQEIAVLETQELELSAKEEILLKQLKEVEKTPEDIIKVLYSEATYTMKISVEKDLRSGESHILSTATIAPLDLQQQGIKVYDDGHKSVYALAPDGRDSQNDMNEMSPLEVEELLMKASEKKDPTDEQLRITPTADSGLGFGRFSPLNQKEDSSVNFMSFLPAEVESGEPVTMIFMGYQNVESDEEDEGIQAELVVISDDDDGEDSEEATLSYHPLGYRSKIFKPNSTVYRSEIRPSAIRTSSSGRQMLGNETKDPTDTGTIRKVRRQFGF